MTLKKECSFFVAYGERLTKSGAYDMLKPIGKQMSAAELRGGKSMRTEQLYYTLAVAQTGSFSKAAEQFFIKQQSLRMAVNHLEEELQVVLFERTPRGVTLTAEGQRCVEDFMKILTVYEGIKVRSATEADKTLLTIGTNSYGSHILCGFMEELSQQYPHVQIKVSEKIHPLLLVKSILSGELDCAVTTIAANILSDDVVLSKNLHKTLAFQPLAEINVGVYVKWDHPLARRRQVSFKALKKYPLISFNELFITEYLNKIAAPEAILDVIVSSNPQMNLSYIYREQGVCLAPRDVMTGLDDQEDVVFLPLEKKVPLILGLFYPLQMPQTKVVTEVLHFLEQAYLKQQGDKKQ